MSLKTGFGLLTEPVQTSQRSTKNYSNVRISQFLSECIVIKQMRAVGLHDKNGDSWIRTFCFFVAAMPQLDLLHELVSIAAKLGLLTLKGFNLSNFV